MREDSLKNPVHGERDCMMMSLYIQKRSLVFQRLAWLLTVLVLMQLLTGCGEGAQADGSSSTPGTLPTTVPTVAHPTPTPTPDQTFLASVLHGPTNFVLDTPYNYIGTSGQTIDNSGTPTPLDEKTIESGITSSFQHALFVVDSHNNVTIYRPGASSPIKAQVTPNDTGGVAIDYTETLNANNGSVNTVFDGVLSNDNMNVSYQQNYSPLLSSDDLSSDVAVAFSAHVQWVPATELPTPPTNGKYQFTGANGITLTWDASQNAKAYDVYRWIPGQDAQFVLINTVTGTSFTDQNDAAWQSGHTSTGVSYGVFAVGPSNVENPGGLPIHVATS